MSLCGDRSRTAAQHPMDAAHRLGPTMCEASCPSGTPRSTPCVDERASRHGRTERLLGKERRASDRRLRRLRLGRRPRVLSAGALAVALPREAVARAPWRQRSRRPRPPGGGPTPPEGGTPVGRARGRGSVPHRLLLCQPEGPQELAALLRGIAACEHCCFGLGSRHRLRAGRDERKSRPLRYASSAAAPSLAAGDRLGRVAAGGYGRGGRRAWVELVVALAPWVFSSPARPPGLLPRSSAEWLDRW
jgi:hypothetical protein